LEYVADVCNFPNGGNGREADSASRDEVVIGTS
jgi:hypothetical protein